MRLSQARGTATRQTRHSQLHRDREAAPKLRTMFPVVEQLRRWRHSDQHSFWIASDGTTAVCHTLTDLELNEVIALWLSFDDYRRRPGFKLSASLLGSIIETELGLTVELDE